MNLRAIASILLVTCLGITKTASGLSFPALNQRGFVGVGSGFYPYYGYRGVHQAIPESILAINAIGDLWLKDGMRREYVARATLLLSKALQNQAQAENQRLRSFGLKMIMDQAYLELSWLYYSTQDQLTQANKLTQANRLLNNLKSNGRMTLNVRQALQIIVQTIPIEKLLEIYDSPFESIDASNFYHTDVNDLVNAEVNRLIPIKPSSEVSRQTQAALRLKLREQLNSQLNKCDKNFPGGNFQSLLQFMYAQNAKGGLSLNRSSIYFNKFLSDIEWLKDSATEYGNNLVQMGFDNRDKLMSFWKQVILELNNRPNL